MLFYPYYAVPIAFLSYLCSLHKNWHLLSFEEHRYSTYYFTGQAILAITEPEAD